MSVAKDGPTARETVQSADLAGARDELVPALLVREPPLRANRSQNSTVSRSFAALTGSLNAASASAANDPGSTNRLERKWVRTSRFTPAVCAASPASLAVECPIACACSAEVCGPYASWTRRSAPLAFSTIS